MSLEKEFEKLNQLRKGEDIESFEEIICEIGQKTGNISHIGKLCKLFDNDVNQPFQAEIIIEMIAKIVERCGMEKGFYELVNNFQHIVERGSEWLYFVNKFFLYSGEYEKYYLDALKSAKKDIKKLVKLCFLEMIEYEDDDEEYLGQIMKYIGIE